LKLTAKEKQIIAEVGARWLHMSDQEILGESALLFRLAVAIVGHHEWLRHKTGRQR